MSILINWVDKPNKIEHFVLKIPLLAGILAVYQAENIIIKTEWCLHCNEPLPFIKDEQCMRVQQYFNNFRTPLILNLQKQGTDFRNKVWGEICKIPVGQVVTYSELAKSTASGARAVANACRDNPFPGIIPCHRVVGVRGLGGYMGQTSGECLEIKKALLKVEESFLI